MLRVAKTENGMVRGLPLADNQITGFKGIPFAKPPVGENRWRAPQPADNWEGIRECYEFAPISVQDRPGMGTDIYCREWHVDKDIPMGEDCLYLNVFTPANSTDDKLPVFVWFFGGGFQWGYTVEREFDAERIARRGMIVVTVNYRVAVMGFLAHPELTKNQPDAPTNFGSLDQQAGLHWVKRNIANFGGDPDNITIAGQSAGGASVLHQLTNKDNADCINKAVVLSGFICDPFIKDPIIAPMTLEASEDNGAEFLKFIGASNIEEARKLDAFYIRDKYAEFANDHLRFAPVVDGKFCIDNPYNLIMEGKYPDIPIMAGNTSDEFMGKTPEESYNGLPENEPFSVIEYSVKNIFSKLSSLNKPNNYYYCFEPDIPGEDNPGTFHSVDLWFFFETLMKSWRTFEGRHYDLARQMCNYMTNFAKTGNPNGDDCNGKKLPEWKPYSKDEHNNMHFTSEGAKPSAGNSELIDMLIEKL